MLELPSADRQMYKDCWSSLVRSTEKRARAARWLSGSGIEIGALHNPLWVPPGVEVRYVDRSSESDLRRQYRELAEEVLVPVSIIGDAQNLSAIVTDSVDFVIANHLLEHLEDPIRGLGEMVRVLRPGGVLYLALPDPRVTFDRDRPLTSVDHVVSEYRCGTARSREDHFVEWVERAEPHIEWMRRAGVKTGPERVRELIDLNYSIHFHVWRPDTFLDFLIEAKRETGIELELVEFTACSRENDDEYIFVFKKGVGSVPPVVPDYVHSKTEPGIDDVDANNATLHGENERLVVEVARLRQELDHAQKAAERAERDYRVAVQTTNMLLDSPSWRITAPLRHLKRVLQRLPG
jgi:SAM-dependent methyltransferase